MRTHQNDRGSNRGLRLEDTPRYSQDITIELFKSPHMDLFEQSSVETFLNATYTHRGGDRMGYFFNGPPLDVYRQRRYRQRSDSIRNCASTSKRTTDYSDGGCPNDRRLCDNRYGGQNRFAESGPIEKRRACPV